MFRRRTLTLPAFVISMVSGGCLNAAPTVSATATLSIAGSERFTNGVWDTGNMTVSFNGFTETVPFGQWSSPASLASGLAARFSRDYLRVGLYAKAGANNSTDLNIITFFLVNGHAFETINFSTNGSASFGLTPTGFSSVNTPPAPLTIGTTSFMEGPGGMGVVITGTGFGARQGSSTITVGGAAATVVGTWSDTQITIQIPLTFANITVQMPASIVISVASSSVMSPFTLDPPFPCPTQ